MTDTRGAIRTFLVECFTPGATADDIPTPTDRIRGAVASHSLGAGAATYLGGIAIPEDEVVFHLFRAASRADVAAMLERAGVSCQRVVEFVSVEPEAQPAHPRTLMRPDEVT